MTWYYVPSISAPATEGSSSPSDSPVSPPEPWLTLSGTPTQRPLSWRGWKTRAWIRRLSGLTSSRSTVARGVAGWISSLPVSPANRSRRRVSVEVSMMSDGSGPTSPGSWLTWDRDSCSWRTSPSLFDSGCLTSSPTLPRSGSMRNGVCSPRPPLVLRTSGNGSGCWQTPKTTDIRMTPRSGDRSDESGNLYDQVIRMWGTPVARDDGKTPEAHLAMKHAMGRSTVTSLAVQAKMWPTPTGMDCKASGGNPDTTGTHGTTLTDAAVRMWPTPKTTDERNATPADHERHSPKLHAVASLHPPTTPTGGGNGSPKADLNPRFLAALMGVPWDWLTPSTSVETDSYQAWLRSHSLGSPDVSECA